MAAAVGWGEEGRRKPPLSMGTAWELVDVLCRGNYWRWVPLPPLRIRCRQGETTTSTANAVTQGGGRAGAAGRDPSGSNTSLEEEDNDDIYGTPTCTPDSTATVQRR